MDGFPRTKVGGLSLSRMIIGTNWFLGFTHTSEAKSRYIRQHLMDRQRIADILEVFLRAGVDTLMGPLPHAHLDDAITDAQGRTGVEVIRVSTPGLPVTAETPEEGFDAGEMERILDEQAALGARFVMPHQSATDRLVDGCTRRIRRMDEVCHLIRERGMIPGLSTHMPESIVYADESGLDVETYISIYNAMGFMMQVEVDWTARIISAARRPVMTIKPMAAGQIRPFQGLTFAWNTIRDRDMVTVGTMSPDEAAECIELSLGILERRQASVPLQETRSKASVKPRG